MTWRRFHLVSPIESVPGSKWVVSDLSEEQIRQKGESAHDVDICGWTHDMERDRDRHGEGGRWHTATSCGDTPKKS